MKIAHVVNDISGTSIPIEIATKINDITDINCHIISRTEIDKIPDTVDADLIKPQISGIRSIRSLMNIINAKRYDIVHTHHNRLAATIGPISKAYNLKHINTQHGHIHYTNPQKILNSITLATADALIYNSNTTKDSYNFVEQIIKQSNPEYVCHNGVDIERISQYTKTINHVDTIATACRLIKRKNIENLIKSMEFVDVDLKIIGDGPRRTALEKLVSKNSFDGDIEFLGYLSDRSEVYHELSMCDAFVLPSNAEGFGVSLAEAMAIGLPCVISDIPIFHEVAGDAGIFVDKDSPESIASGISDIQSDSDLARALSEQSKVRIRNSFPLSKTAMSYANVYYEISNKNNITEPK